MQANFCLSMYEIQMSHVRFITNHNTLVSSNKLLKFINMSVHGYNLSFAGPRLSSLQDQLPNSSVWCRVRDTSHTNICDRIHLQAMQQPAG